MSTITEKMKRHLEYVDAVPEKKAKYNVTPELGEHIYSSEPEKQEEVVEENSEEIVNYQELSDRIDQLDTKLTETKDEIRQMFAEFGRKLDASINASNEVIKLIKQSTYTGDN